MFRSKLAIAKIYVLLFLFGISCAWENDVNCGKRDDFGRRQLITNGQIADTYEFPWQIRLLNWDSRLQKHVFSCGGSILNEEWILTAAHCIEAPPRLLHPWELRVVAGEYHVGVNDTDVLQEVDVAGVFAHPGYDLLAWAIHDIAILKLATPLNLSKASPWKVNTICLPEQDDTSPLYGETMFHAGFGLLDEYLDSPDQMHFVESVVHTRERCHALLGSYFYPNTTLCFNAPHDRIDSPHSMYFDTAQDTCNGDSGGPLVHQRPSGQFFVEGLVSHGQGCGNLLTPGYDTKVRSYVDWIDETMRNSDVLMNDNCPHYCKLYPDQDVGDGVCNEECNHSDCTEYFLDGVFYDGGDCVDHTFTLGDENFICREGSVNRNVSFVDDGEEFNCGQINDDCMDGSCDLSEEHYQTLEDYGCCSTNSTDPLQSTTTRIQSTTTRIQSTNLIQSTTSTSSTNDTCTDDDARIGALFTDPAITCRDMARFDYCNQIIIGIDINAVCPLACTNCGNVISTTVEPTQSSNTGCVDDNARLAEHVGSSLFTCEFAASSNYCGSDILGLEVDEVCAKTCTGCESEDDANSTVEPTEDDMTGCFDNNELLADTFGNSEITCQMAARLNLCGENFGFDAVEFDSVCARSCNKCGVDSEVHCTDADIANDFTYTFCSSDREHSHMKGDVGFLQPGPCVEVPEGRCAEGFTMCKNGENEFLCAPSDGVGHPAICEQCIMGGMDYYMGECRLSGGMRPAGTTLLATDQTECAEARDRTILQLNCVRQSSCGECVADSNCLWSEVAQLCFYESYTILRDASNTCDGSGVVQNECLDDHVKVSQAYGYPMYHCVFITESLGSHLCDVGIFNGINLAEVCPVSCDRCDTSTAPTQTPEDPTTQTSEDETTQTPEDATSLSPYDAPDAKIMGKLGRLLEKEASENRWNKVRNRAKDILQQEHSGDRLNPEVVDAMDMIRKLWKRGFSEKRWAKMRQYFDEVEHQG